MPVMKYLITNRNYHKSKLALFREFNFLMNKDIYVNKGTLWIFDIVH